MTDNAVTCWGLHYYTKIGSDGYTAGDHPLLVSGTPTYTGFGNVICF